MADSLTLQHDLGSPLRYIHHSRHNSSVSKTTPQTRVLTSISGVQRRFARAMELYALGVAQHVQDFTESGLPCPQEMLETRRLSVGVAPLYHLVEYAHSIRLPDEVFEDPAIQTLERLGADMVIM